MAAIVWARLVILRFLVSFVVGDLLGVASGFALGIFFYPYIFLADIVGADKVNAAETRQVLAKGTFIHADPSDPIHYGKGYVTVYHDLVHMQASLEVGPRGSQKYLVPEGVDLTMYRSLVIWCEQLRVLISPTALKACGPRVRSCFTLCKLPRI